uniref:Amyloid beta protein binding family B member 3 n=1 Tax=Macaca fascicularis TaxID=9541 RepID=A0A7N9CTK6_MACFA
MLGKDYMLAIILVNCDDDLWGDQSLEGEPGLPPGWRKIHDAAGTYYWHVPSGSTQWQRPAWELGDAEDPGTGTEGIWGLRPLKGRSFSSLESSLDRSNSLSWCGEESYIQNMEPGAKCFAVRSLGWVEVPEEDLAPGKSSIAVSQAAQKYEALYMGTLPVTKAMGMDVLNEAIGTLTTRGDRNAWVPTMLSVSDSLMTAHPIQAEASTEEEPLWQCPVRLVTFIGVGRDPHTFGLIADLGRQSFQCAAFWCQPHAGGLSEAVQAACMVQYQKCLVASAARGKAWGAQARARLRLKRTSSMDSPGGPLPLPLLKGGVGGAGATPRKRGVFSFLDAFRLKPSLLHMP